MYRKVVIRVGLHDFSVTVFCVEVPQQSSDLMLRLGDLLLDELTSNIELSNANVHDFRGGERSASRPKEVTR